MTELELSPAITLKNVDKEYSRPSALKVFKNVSLDIPSPSFTVITGESGSGKTTLLNLFGGLDIPDQGTVTVLGTDITKLNEPELARWRLQNVGFVFQNYNLISTFTAEENVALPLEIMEVEWEEEEIKEKTNALLSQVKLADRRLHFPHQLSGGEQQRLALARALVTNPTLLLADEPTGNLDDDTGALIRKIMTDFYKQGKTVIVASHDHNITKLATKLIRLPFGKE